MWQMKKKHEKPIENVEIAHCWHHIYSILCKFLFIPPCYFHDFSERDQFNKEEQNQSLSQSQNIDNQLYSFTGQYVLKITKSNPARKQSFFISISRFSAY